MMVQRARTALLLVGGGAPPLAECLDVAAEVFAMFVQPRDADAATPGAQVRRDLLPKPQPLRFQRRHVARKAEDLLGGEPLQQHIGMQFAGGLQQLVKIGGVDAHRCPCPRRSGQEFAVLHDRRRGGGLIGLRLLRSDNAILDLVELVEHVAQEIAVEPGLAMLGLDE